jgi:uncharacterized protein DUF4236
MGFYLRKAFSFGPVRLNLSRSGLGMSVGVTGARIGIGPRGRYVHLGRGGVYYRQSLGGTDRGVSRQPTAVVDPSFAEIESEPAAEMLDSSGAGLLEELNRVQARIALTPIAIVVGMLSLVGAMVITTQMRENERARPVVRANPPDALSSAEILRERYVNLVKRHEQLAAARDAALVRWWYLVFGTAVAVGLSLAVFARHRDVTRGTASLAYDLEPSATEWFSHVVSAFTDLASCERVWHVQAQGATDDWKRNAGATTLVKRRVISPVLSLPRRVQCNLRVPSLTGGRQTLYFFPDRLLVYERSSVGAVAYAQLSVSATDTHFREEGAVPSDAINIGMTWRYVNKSGGPDRRFNNNTQIPVMRYAELHFTSATGLNELFQVSRLEPGKKFAATLSDAKPKEAGRD